MAVELLDQQLVQLDEGPVGELGAGGAERALGRCDGGQSATGENPKEAVELVLHRALKQVQDEDDDGIKRELTLARECLGIAAVTIEELRCRKSSPEGAKQRGTQFSVHGPCQFYRPSSSPASSSSSWSGTCAEHYCYTYHLSGHCSMQQDSTPVSAVHWMHHRDDPSAGAGQADSVKRYDPATGHHRRRLKLMTLEVCAGVPTAGAAQITFGSGGAPPKRRAAEVFLQAAFRWTQTCRTL